jgi:hypothetical protein
MKTIISQPEGTLDASVVAWLLEGDPAIRWQTLRDLTNAREEALERERRKVSTEGWGARLLAVQDDSGLWASGLYSPKWTSTTYTMLLLRQFGLEPSHPKAQKACWQLLNRGFFRDGGINFFASFKHSETCVTGMILSILAHFQYPDGRVLRLVDHLLGQQMPDGGWNCESYAGATHSSFHTTISVLEGLRELERVNPYRDSELRAARSRACEFLLVHRLFRSHRTGEVVDSRMTRFSFPPRWHYDILRALDYLQEVRLPLDSRLNDALEIVRQRRGEDGRWILQNRYAGKTFFELEAPGKPSRWNTLRALRVLRWFEAKKRPDSELPLSRATR